MRGGTDMCGSSELFHHQKVNILKQRVVSWSRIRKKVSVRNAGWAQNTPLLNRQAVGAALFCIKVKHKMCKWESLLWLIID